MLRKIINVIATLVLIAGLCIFFYPDYSQWMLDRETDEAIDEFMEMYGGTELSEEENPETGTEAVSEISSEAEEQVIVSSTEETVTYVTKKTVGKFEGSEELYERIAEYNQHIYETNQEDFYYDWSFSETPISLEGLKDGLYGYIEVPAMNVTLPIYIGASRANMAKGAAVMGQTSIPIGGINTNSVIVGHRGWKGSAYFRDIEEVELGDKVYITNPWETLVYQVVKIEVIDPDDSPKLLIQEGKDMVTLVTCHPYRSHGKRRYVLYCERDEDGLTETVTKETVTTVKSTEGEAGSEALEESGSEIEDGSYIVDDSGEEFESSEEDIRLELILRRGGTVVIILLLIYMIVTLRKSKKGE